MTVQWWAREHHRLCDVNRVYSFSFLFFCPFLLLWPSCLALAIAPCLFLPSFFSWYLLWLFPQSHTHYARSVFPLVMKRNKKTRRYRQASNIRLHFVLCNLSKECLLDASKCHGRIISVCTLALSWWWNESEAQSTRREPRGKKKERKNEMKEKKDKEFTSASCNRRRNVVHCCRMSTRVTDNSWWLNVTVSEGRTEYTE